MRPESFSITIVSHFLPLPHFTFLLWLTPLPSHRHLLLYFWEYFFCLPTLSSPYLIFCLGKHSVTDIQSFTVLMPSHSWRFGSEMSPEAQVLKTWFPEGGAIERWLAHIGAEQGCLEMGPDQSCKSLMGLFWLWSWSLLPGTHEEIVLSACFFSFQVQGCGTW